MDMEIKHVQQLELRQVELTDGRVFRGSADLSAWIHITGDPRAPFPEYEYTDADVSAELKRLYEERNRGGIPPTYFMP